MKDRKYHLNRNCNSIIPEIKNNYMFLSADDDNKGKSQ